MKVVFFVKKDNQAQAKNKVYGDDVVSRQTIIIRDNASLGIKKDGYYMQIEGNDDALKHAEKILKGLADKMGGKDAKQVMDAIEEQESSAASGFGAIFG